ncbi:MAG: hypothetical protein COV59_03810 [Candidatus Magasanikbacteria bacterium CG11_big_fil_rev_8_21_14_0_20_39_34]|uniref:Uncharacterized protein n=1 Tax=Candidatus Magasanikbacteria bacterium CG11_big_fil_rev_8_21_14_0_20_39_34 TaxID=1974653 RepID=A0A2H0N4F0_9BACT|nr:MAG: hypothetical protein COV59_03810 [Candidatus Magasanikbacteria bacterium CG11_big_fil_rev_8_21_14_0_20_39_34]
MTNVNLVLTIDVLLIQSLAEANLGRELTDAELKRIPVTLIDDEAVATAFDCLFIDIARAVTKEDKDWEEYDKEHSKSSLSDLLDIR